MNLIYDVTEHFLHEIIFSNVSFRSHLTQQGVHYDRPDLFQNQIDSKSEEDLGHDYLCQISQIHHIL